MKVAICQTNILWKDREANREHFSELIEKISNADICILPEMWSTGFAVMPDGAAEKIRDPKNQFSCKSVMWMKELAVRKDMAIVGSIAVEENGKYYNRLYFVKPDGTCEYYNKHHLFTYGKEDEHYTAGDRRVVVEFRKFRILLQVCYDLRFPTFSRNHKDYDMAIYVASWPQSRQSAWDTLLRARAIENQCYLAGVNRIGIDPNCQYAGGSAIIDPYGETLSAFAQNQQGIAVADLSIESLQAFREKFPVLNDAD